MPDKINASTLPAWDATNTILGHLLSHGKRSIDWNAGYVFGYTAAEADHAELDEQRAHLIDCSLVAIANQMDPTSAAYRGLEALRDLLMRDPRRAAQALPTERQTA